MNNNLSIAYDYALDIYKFIEEYINVIETLTNSNQKIRLQENVINYELIYKNIDIYFYNDYYNIYIDYISDEQIERVSKYTYFCFEFKKRDDDIIYMSLVNDYKSIENLKSIIMEIV